MPILILGASCRAAAYSAHRAGLEPTAVDLFADADLTALAPTRRIDAADYPQGLADLAAEAAPGPWFYTGGLENHPELVDRIARSRPLWGNGGDVLRAVRDPFEWSARLQRAGLPCPAVRSRADGLPRDGTWLMKPLASAGGHGVVPLGPGTEGSHDDERRNDGGYYYQERVEGVSMSALFVGLADASPPWFAGVTRQLIGRPESPFAYVGSVGPWPLSVVEAARVRELGVLLARAFGLKGLFGLDFILRDGRPWPVEINPRYTASVEVLELARGESLLAAHGSAFDPTFPRPEPFGSSLADGATRPGVEGRPRRVVGKLILYATGRCGFPRATRPRTPSLNAADRFAIPTLGDRPQPGTRFEPGEPIATLFAHADAPDACLDRLRRRQAQWQRRLVAFS